jgi:hypothetical protein
MKIRLLNGLPVIALGLLVSLGPQFLFKACAPVAGPLDAHGSGTWMKCHWSVQAELGIGGLIAALGIAILLFRSRETRLGLFVGVFFASIVALFVPHALIGGCGMETMPCRALTFPAITVLAVLLVAVSSGNIFFLRKECKT